MSRTLHYHHLFASDVTEAADWYDRQSPGLGDRFTSIVEQTVDDIRSDPKRFAVTESGCRYIRTRTFPYVVLFNVTDTELLMLGVLHTARSRDKWRERVSDQP